MTKAKSHEWSNGIKALSVVLAVLVWLSVLLERPGEMRISVPVTLERLPAGLWLNAPPPPELQVVVAGPRVLLLLLPLRPVRCELDLSAAAPGQVSVAPTQGSFGLDPELKVVRVFPEWVTLTLARK